MVSIPNWKRLKDDPAFRARMEKRAVIVRAIRDFFLAEGFMEVETPTLVAFPGTEPHLEPFVTELKRHDGASHVAHLITSPEYSMKKLLAGGLPKIFEITRAYRNGEPFSAAGGSAPGGGDYGRHNPEFTMIEWYRAGADYRALMADTERLCASVAEKAVGAARFEHRGTTYDLASPWPRLSVAEAFDRFAGIDLGRGIDDQEWFRSAVEAKDVVLAPDDRFDDVFFKIFLRDIEPKLGTDRPVILHDYPRSMAALARIKPDDGRYAERFEAYCAGLELCNAYSELNDPVEQRRRIMEDLGQRRSLGRDAYGVDEQFIEAVGMMPDSAGIAFGVDRLVMLLTDAPGIRDVLFFPAGDLFDSDKVTK